MSALDTGSKEGTFMPILTSCYIRKQAIISIDCKQGITMEKLTVYRVRPSSWRQYSVYTDSKHSETHKLSD